MPEIVPCSSVEEESSSPIAEPATIIGGRKQSTSSKPCSTSSNVSWPGPEPQSHSHTHANVAASEVDNSVNDPVSFSSQSSDKTQCHNQPAPINSTDRWNNRGQSLRKKLSRHLSRTPSSEAEPYPTLGSEPNTVVNDSAGAGANHSTYVVADSSTVQPKRRFLTRSFSAHGHTSSLSSRKKQGLHLSRPQSTEEEPCLSPGPETNGEIPPGPGAGHSQSAVRTEDSSPVQPKSQIVARRSSSHGHSWSSRSLSRPFSFKSSSPRSSQKRSTSRQSSEDPSDSAGTAVHKQASRTRSSPTPQTASDSSVMIAKGPRGTVDVMPPELLGRLEGHKSGLLQSSPIKSRTIGSGGVDQFHTLQKIKKGKSDEDLSSSHKKAMSGSGSNGCPDSNATNNVSSPSPATKARFRRRASTNMAKKSAISLEISNPMPGTFRKVAGVREDRTDGAGGAGSGERSQTVEIDLGKDKSQVGFEYDLRKWPTLDVQEVRVMGITPGGVVETQHLLEIGDTISKVNGVSISKIGNRDELQFLMSSESTLILTVSRRSPSDTERQSAVGNPPRPATADGFFTTPEPPGGARSGQSQLSGASPDPLQMNTVAQFVPCDINPEDMECEYDAIELYPEKKDPKKAAQATESTASPVTDDDAWMQESGRRESLSLVECMENVVDVLLSKDLTGQERRQRLTEHLGMDVNLPSLEEEPKGMEEPTVRTQANVPQHYNATTESIASSRSADCDNGHVEEITGARAGSDESSASVPPLMYTSDNNEARGDDGDDGEDEHVNRGDRVGNAGSDSSDDRDDDDAAADTGGKPAMGNLDVVSSDSVRPRLNSLRSLSGVLHVTMHGGSDFIPSSSLRCVASTDTHLKQDTRRATVSSDGSIDWEESFELEIDDTRSLVVSCFASTGTSRDSLTGRATVHLEALFRVAGERNLQLDLAPKGSVRLDLEFSERSRLLKRFPSDDQYFGVFGIDLQELVSRERRAIPIIAEKCMEEINARGLSQISLYRVAGSFKEKEALRNGFETDSSIVQLSEDDVPDVTIIAALLKDYLRELPEPLLTNMFCVDLVRAARRTASDGVRQQRIFDILQALPAANLDLARMLFRHFHRLLQQSASNKLGVHSLSVCLGPILLCPSPHARGTAQESVDFDGMSGVMEAMLDFGWPDTAYTNEETMF
ncbi:uncharacterized protein LOC135805792 [Sycon ciliatum]|uniref:uncharacterized protein LOC135805792 n=1 Tax=Sycon ciliatum TaxID=27933 RepID=UPI0031F6F04D